MLEIDLVNTIKMEKHGKTTELIKECIKAIDDIIRGEEDGNK